MEIMSIFLPVVVLLSTFAFLCLIVSKSMQPTTRSTGHYPLPPGNTGWPMIGETLEFISHMLKGIPERFIHDRISKYGSSTFKTSLLGDQTTVLYGPAGNKFLFANEEKLVRQVWPITTRTLFGVGNSKEGLARVGIFTHSFLKQDSVQKYVGVMDSIAQSHFEAKWHATEQVVVYTMAKGYTLSLACRLLVSIEDVNFLEKMADELSRVMDGSMCLPINLPWTRFGRAIQASKAITAYLMTIIRNKRQEIALAVKKDSSYKDIASSTDIMSSMLVNADETGNYMSDSQVAAANLGILVAGHDTASVVITLIFKYLGETPEIYQKVFEEQMEISRNKAEGELLNYNDINKMKYSWNVAQEVLRIYPPAICVFREALSDFTYSDYHIPKGSKLQLSIHATQRDEKYFPSPEKFDPSRFEKKGPLPYTYVPFGGGPRMCPGLSYARLEILVYLHNAVKRFKWDNIFPDEKITIDPLPKPVKGLPIKLHSHQKLSSIENY